MTIFLLLFVVQLRLTLHVRDGSGTSRNTRVPAKQEHVQNSLRHVSNAGAGSGCPTFINARKIQALVQLDLAHTRRI